MKLSPSILFTEKKKVVKFNPKENKYDWEIDFKYRVSGLSRIEDYVFVTTYSNWGKPFTHLIDFDKGKILWEVEDIFYSVHIIENTLIYYNKKKYFTAINIASGEKIFFVKSPFKWTSPKAILLNGNFYIYSSKNTYVVNLKNGAFSESRLPDKFDPKEVGLVLDEFQININNLPSAGGDYGGAHMVDGGGSDTGGGDGGGGGEG